jgi:hypothetical protein
MRSRAMTLQPACPTCGVTFRPTVPGQIYCTGCGRASREIGKLRNGRKLSDDATPELFRRYGTHRENAPVSAWHNGPAVRATTEDCLLRAREVERILARLRG